MTNNFYSEPLTGFSKNAHKTLADHQNKSGTIHPKTVPIYDNFMKILKGKMLAIKDQVKLKPDQVIFRQTVLKSATGLEWLSVRLRTKWFWVRVQLQSLHLQISRLLRARSSLTFRQL